MQEVKSKWMVYKVNEMVSDEVSERWYADPENEELERFADRAYEEMHRALDEFCAEVERFTGGQVDARTAKRMAVCPKYSGKLEALMARVA